jgi:transposase-like protein
LTKRKRYTDEFRASAVLMLEAAGYPNTEGALSRVAMHLNVPARTLSRWFNGEQNPPPDQSVTIKRRDLREMLQDILYGFSAEVLRRIDANELEDVPLNQIMQGLGISFDKNQLLHNKPTEIIEDAALTDTERANRIAALLDRARARRDGQPVDDGAAARLH